MSAAQILADQDRINKHREEAEALRPWGQYESKLYRILKGSKSTVTILSGNSGTGKSTYLPAIVATHIGKTLLSHPNPLAIRTTYNWMESNRQGDMFARGAMSGKVELVTNYYPGKFGYANHLQPINLTFATHSIVSALITNDRTDGLDTLRSYRIFFIDEVHIKSVELENLLLRIKEIIQKRDLEENPIHFVLSSSYLILQS